MVLPGALLLLCLFLIQTASAQLTLDAQLRPRSEWRDGYRYLPQGDNSSAFFISQRSRLGLTYLDNYIKLRLSAQDVRVWGDEVQMAVQPSLALHEAWAEVLLLKNNLSLRLGRQELVYNQHRLLGNVDWVQQARSHDAALLKLRLAGLEADLGGAFNQNKENMHGTLYTPANYKVLGFLWLQKKFTDKLSLSTLTITDGFQAEDGEKEVLYRYTYGFDLAYKPEKVQFQASLYGQSGKSQDRKSIEAYMGTLELSYHAKPLLISLGTEYLSGGEEENQIHTFNTLYATNHKFYGYMDYFLNIPNDTRGGGLHDSYLKAFYQLNQESTLDLHYHLFALAANLSPSETLTANNGKYLGSELDTSYGYRVSEFVKLSCGYSILAADKNMEALRGGKAAGLNSWGWLMINIHPSFILMKPEANAAD